MELNESELEQAINQLSSNTNKAEIISNLVEKGYNVPEKHITWAIQYYKNNLMRKSAGKLAEKAAESAKKLGLDKKAQKIYSLAIKMWDEYASACAWDHEEARKAANELYHKAIEMYNRAASRDGRLKRDALKKVALLAREAGFSDKENAVYRKILEDIYNTPEWIDKELGYDNIQGLAIKALEEGKTGLADVLLQHYERVKKFDAAEELAQKFGNTKKIEAYRILKEIFS